VPHPRAPAHPNPATVTPSSRSDRAPWTPVPAPRGQQAPWRDVLGVMADHIFFSIDILLILGLVLAGAMAQWRQGDDERLLVFGSMESLAHVPALHSEHTTLDPMPARLPWNVPPPGRHAARGGLNCPHSTFGGPSISVSTRSMNASNSSREWKRAT
jgi:hypothetical protein